MLLNNFTKKAVVFINEHKHEIQQHAEHIKISGEYKDFNARLAFDCFYAHQKSERIQNNSELLSQIAESCNISTNLINDNHIFTLYKKALKNCGIL